MCILKALVLWLVLLPTKRVLLDARALSASNCLVVILSSAPWTTMFSSGVLQAAFLRYGSTSLMCNLRVRMIKLKSRKCDICSYLHYRIATDYNYISRKYISNNMVEWNKKSQSRPTKKRSKLNVLHIKPLNTKWSVYSAHFQTLQMI